MRLLLATLALLVSFPAEAQVNCQTAGSVTHCSHRQDSQQREKVTDDKQGNSARGPGDETDDTSYLRLGNTVYDNQGNAWRDLEGTTYGSEGTLCQRLGHFLYCN